MSNIVEVPEEMVKAAAYALEQMQAAGCQYGPTLTPKCVRFWAERLWSLGITASEIRSTSDEVVVTHDKHPSLSQFIRAVMATRPGINWMASCSAEMNGNQPVVRYSALPPDGVSRFETEEQALEAIGYKKPVVKRSKAAKAFAKQKVKEIVEP